MTEHDPLELAAVIEEHLPLVKQVVFQVAIHFPKHVDRNELARAGALGLVEAARRFDESRGVPFNRFAAQRIRGAILDAVRAADWAPRSVRNMGRRLEQTEQLLATELGRTATQEECAQSMGVTVEEIKRLKERMYRSVVLALDHEVYDGPEEDLRLIDVLPDADAVDPADELESRERLGYMRDAIHLLPERHALVVTGYFLENRTSQELARFLGVTESRISQLRSEALTMLREGIEAQYKPPAMQTTPGGRSARRRERYATAISEASNWKDRLSQPEKPEELTVVLH